MTMLFRYLEKDQDGKDIITSTLLSDNTDWRVYNRKMPDESHVVVLEIPRRINTEYVELYYGTAAACQNLIQRISTCESSVNLARYKKYIGNELVDIDED